MSENKKSKIWEVLSKEYKYESLLLVFLSIVIMVISAYIINGTLTIKEDFFLIGGFPLVAAWIFFAAGFVGLVVGSWPIFKPSFKEVRRLTPPTRKIYFDHIVKVFTFIIGLTIVFLAFDSIITALIGLIV